MLRAFAMTSTAALIALSLAACSGVEATNGQQTSQANQANDVTADTCAGYPAGISRGPTAEKCEPSSGSTVGVPVTQGTADSCAGYPAGASRGPTAENMQRASGSTAGTAGPSRGGADDCYPRLPGGVQSPTR